VLIRNARVWPTQPSGTTIDGPLAGIPLTDIRVTGGHVADCAPGLRSLPGEDEIDAAGGGVLPGLHDHHVHLRALAAARASVQVGPRHVRTGAGLRSRLREADAAAVPGAWLRCVGYHESVAGDLDRWALDRMLPHRPVRVQHRTGALWMLNSAAVNQAGLATCQLPGVERDSGGRPTGRLWRLDGWLAAHVPSQPPDLAAVSADAAVLGVTGFTDATPDASERDIAFFAAAVAAGAVAQRLHCMAPPDVRAPDGSGVAIGPVKILLDDATLPALHELASQMRAAHAAGRAVAVHCVTRIQLVVTLAALDAAGRLPGDRIEHGAVIPAECLPDLHGVTVVTQPHFVAERGEQYRAEVPAEDRPDLWRLRSLLDAGVPAAAGTDAPFGGADPWHVMRAATRRAALGFGLGPGEAIGAAAAMGLFLGHPAAPATPRVIAPGHPGDLVVLRVPPAEAARSLASDLVAATLVAGEPVYLRLLRQKEVRRRVPRLRRDQRARTLARGGGTCRPPSAAGRRPSTRMPGP
jgi:predicted amidohydrolase YtcJ